MSAVSHFASATFRHEVLESDLPVVLDVRTTWSGPSRQLIPPPDQLAGGVEVVTGEADANTVSIAAFSGARTTPAIAEKVEVLPA
ncbi:thiol reductase thioredoxin [Rothia halotolerans]|uniref:thiol reductase thioredoxin n=1 Tax=Rothia halotolerans TaxID=405770 RepID=UPI00101BA3BB|nr:thiol reductase thioredoxin [Rothia halotolerans]